MPKKKDMATKPKGKFDKVFWLAMYLMLIPILCLLVWALK